MKNTISNAGKIKILMLRNFRLRPPIKIKWFRFVSDRRNAAGGTK